MVFRLLTEMTGLARDIVSLWWEGLGGGSPRFDSVSVVDIFTDQARLPHCGTVFLTRVKGQIPGQTVLIIPKKQNTASFMEEEEAEPVVTIHAETMERVFFTWLDGTGESCQWVVVCLTLTTGEDSKAGRENTRIFFIVEYQQVRIFIRYLPILKMERVLLTSLTLSNSFLGKFDKNKVKKVKESLYNDYIRPYIFFSSQYPRRDQLKDVLQNSRNLPMLLNKMHFDCKLIQRALFDFIRLHKCKNKHCDGFSSIKCSGCKYIRYCDAKCQEMDFEKHFKVCQKIKKEKEKTFHVGLILQKELQNRTCQPKLYSFEFFISNVLASVFQAFSGYLTEGSLEEQIENDLENHKIEHIDWNNLTKLSNQKTTDRSRLKSQMVHQFGEGNFLTEEDLDATTISNQVTSLVTFIINTLYKVLLTAWFLTKSYKLAVGIPPFSSWW